MYKEVYMVANVLRAIALAAAVIHNFGTCLSHGSA